jgi:hypothetical protein
MLQKIFLVVFVGLFLFSCEEEVLTPDPCGEKNIIRLLVRDTLNLPYKFKDTQTHLNDTTLILSYEDLNNPSALVVITDDQIDKLSDSLNHLTVRAYNFKDSLILVEKFVVTKDSCHVIYVSGPKRVTIR